MAGAGGEQVSHGVSRDAEQSGMAERDQSGIADQNIQPQREHGIEQNLTRDIDVIDFADRIGHCGQRQDGDGDGDAAGGRGAEHDGAHRIWPPNRPCGRNTKTNTIGRNRMK